MDRILRLIFVLFVATLAVVLFAVSRPLPQVEASQPNPTVRENALLGADTWRLNRPGYRTANDRDKQIKGYASRASVNKGEAITFFVHTASVQTYTLDIYRLGWYSGKGARLVAHVGTLQGGPQQDCSNDATTGLLECHWQPSYVLTVPDYWTSGIFLGLLTSADHYQNYMVFVVRDDARVGDFLVQQAAITYQAYNNYPNDGATGKSLYSNLSYGPPTLTGQIGAVKVSFDRPYANEGVGQYLQFQLELSALGWLEREGYDLTYSTDIDTHTTPKRLTQFKGFLVIGHDEYWSRQMNVAVRAARESGVNLAFLSGNIDFHQIRLEPSTGGEPNRVVVCYRYSNFDPEPDPALKTIRWRLNPVNWPEQTLLGVQYTQLVTQTFYYDDIQTGHWAFAGTGLRPGDRLIGPATTETDRLQPQYPMPPNIWYTTLATATVTTDSGGHDITQMSLYQAPSGALVFAAGSLAAPFTLDVWGGNPPAQRLVQNILDAFRQGTGATPTPTTCNSSFSDVWDSDIYRSYILTLACQGIVSGYADGTFHPAALVTRGQAAKILASAAAFPDPLNSRQQTFADVPPNSPFWPYVERLAARRIISGYGCGGGDLPCDIAARPYFHPSASVTRGQLMKMTMKALGSADTPTDQIFADVAPDSPFFTPIQQAASRGIIGGYGCAAPELPCDDRQRPYFEPGRAVNRGQTAKIVASAFAPAQTQPTATPETALNTK